MPPSSRHSRTKKSTPSNPYPYDTNLIEELLKRKRKTRGIKSCFPCRHRKVKCDGGVPCGSCVKRGHGELCRVPDHAEEEADVDLDITPQKNKRRNNDDGKSNADLISRLTEIETQISSLKADLLKSSSSPSNTSSAKSSPSPGPPEKTRMTRSGSHYVEDATGATIYLGSHSDTPLALGCREVSSEVMVQDILMDQVVPRTYPFTTLWGADVEVRDICETLPGEEDIIRYWQTYQSTPYPFYPALVTMAQFTTSLFEFLERPDRHYINVNPSWLALLFAVLACGVQFSDDAVQDRDLRSKVFICSSFQCLRMSNFFNQTDLDQIQAMALIGHCLRNNLDTNSAWILMGSTIRLAQSIGLHESEDPDRKRLWWMLIWQDTFLSFTYDRPPSSIPNLTLPSFSEGNATFAESVFSICHIIHDRGRNSTPTNLLETKQYKQKFDQVHHNAAPFLRDKAHCTTLQEHLERLALGIHLGYGICRIIRDLDPSQSETDLTNECIHQAQNVLQCFLDLHRYSSRVCRSWAFVHNTVSCALTLVNLAVNGEVDLVKRVVQVLEKEDKASEWRDGDTNTRYFGPYSRALRALRLRDNK